MPAAKTTLTGYPVRPFFFEAQRAAAHQRFGLDPSLPTLLVTGGSTGAVTINHAVVRWAPQFLRTGQLFHIGGANDAGWLQAQRDQLPPDLKQRYHLHTYLHDGMAEAMAAADLAIMRAGASVLGELPATRLPAILIPGDFSDQQLNALYLEREGAAVMLPQSLLAELPKLVMDLIGDSQRLDRMREALGRLARPDAAERLAHLVAELAAVKEQVTIG
jgi:UDP-N-acetylglucosamine--N-acetylmuramyl-(pentapeptide) pyrophosphoryl-undecaprenol N-acetylglucosamine transferase